MVAKTRNVGIGRHNGTRGFAMLIRTITSSSRQSRASGGTAASMIRMEIGLEKDVSFAMADVCGGPTNHPYLSKLVSGAREFHFIQQRPIIKWYS